MVSIPSSQIKNIMYYDIEAQKAAVKNSKPQPSIKSIIKEAENKGYFTHLTAEYLITNFIKDYKATDLNYENFEILKVIKVISLYQQNIQKINSLEYCRNLVYLNLSKNFVSDFTALKFCQKLICLDLSANLIETLPDFNFWAKMIQLKFLYMHDNPIANPDSIMGLCSCPNLVVFTLWDTPLALKRKYRHFIVNSIWSLKVLDHHFVSDEEIIEDADFKNSYFRSVSNKLKINSYRAYNLDDEKAISNDLKKFIVEINKMMSHLSPVLIIQKVVRGHLVRKRNKKVKSVPPQVKVNLPKITQSQTLPQKNDTEPKDNVKYLKIDLIHLNKGPTLENMDKEASIRNLLASALNMVTYRSFIKQDQDKCSPEHISRALRTETFTAENSDYFHGASDDKISFKFRGTKPPITMKNHATELLTEKNRSHYFIREADRNYHEKLSTQLPEINNRPLKKVNSNILFHKAQDCMSLFLLNKWDKADREVENIQRFHDKIAAVQLMRNEKELCNLRVEEAKLKKVAIIKSQHDDHKNQVEKATEIEKRNQKMISEEVKMKKLEAAEKRSKLMREMGFSKDFRSKQTAASKAVDKFEQMTYKQEQAESSKVAVEETRKKMKLEMETVKTYLENQAFNRRTERNIETSALDLQILQQTNSRMNDAKMRVEKLKTIHRLVSCPKIPVIQMSVESMKT